MTKYICSVCEYEYDETKEDVMWINLLESWSCPVCESDKSHFSMGEIVQEVQIPQSREKNLSYYRKKSRELLSGVCSANKVCDGSNERLCQGQKFEKAIGFGGAGQGLTFDANYKALRKYKLKMRVVKSHNEPKTETVIFGKKITMPLLVASVSGMKINFNDAISEIEFQKGMIKGAIKFGTLGLSGNTPGFPDNPGVEIIKDNNGHGIPVFKPQAQSKLKELFIKAEKAGCPAIGVDIDGCGSTNWAMKGKPVYRKSLIELKELVNFTKKPVFFKGIMSIEDARACFEAGAEGIVISNHGGRVMDCGQGVAEVLPEIAEEFSGKITIIADGAVRTGYDVLILLALGADAVMIGRELARMSLSGGADAVNMYLEYVKKEFRTAMYMTGCDNLNEINNKILIGGKKNE